MQRDLSKIHGNPENCLSHQGITLYPFLLINVAFSRDVRKIDLQQLILTYFIYQPGECNDILKYYS